MANTLNTLAQTGKNLGFLTGIALLLMTAPKEAKAWGKRPVTKPSQKTIQFDTIRSNLDAISIYADSTRQLSLKYTNEPEQLAGGLIKGMDYNGVFYRAYPETVIKIPTGGYQLSTHPIWDKYINLATKAGILPKTENPAKTFSVNVQTNGAFTAVNIGTKNGNVSSFLYDESQKRFLILTDSQVMVIDLLGKNNVQNGPSVRVTTVAPLISMNVCGRSANRDDVIINFDKNGNNGQSNSEADKNIEEISSLLNTILIERVIKKNDPVIDLKILKRKNRQR